LPDYVGTYVGHPGQTLEIVAGYELATIILPTLIAARIHHAEASPLK